MSEHTALVHWLCGDASFTDNRYSRRHAWTFDGGATLAASASPQVVPQPWSDPAAVDPEEAFVAALSSCHMLWFLSIAARAGYRVEEYRDEARGLLARDAEGQAAITVVTLRPWVRFGDGPQPDAAGLNQLHHEAHDACFLARSVRSEIRCEPVSG